MKKIIVALLTILLVANCAYATSVGNAPSIKGSNAYDIVISLEEIGIEKPERKQILGGYQWTSTPILIDGNAVMYDIITNSDHEIVTSKFTYMGKDIGYLHFVSTMPYDSNDIKEATAFVNSFAGAEITTQIGDAKYTLLPVTTGTGAILTIEDEEYLSWLLSTI